MRLMAMGWIGVFVLLGLWLMLAAFGDGTTTVPAGAGENRETRVAVTFLGGYDTNPVDRGRPVVLVASALGVPEETFRAAFKGVHPAPPGSGGPTGEEARANKAALMTVLGPLGVTNDRLDEVSNYYRYRREAGELWKHVPAEGYARVKEGKIVGFVVTKSGAGYSSVPEVHVAGFAGARATAVVDYGKDLGTNGSIMDITLGH